MNHDRTWMYERTDARGFLSTRFVVGVEEFINYVVSQPSSVNGTSIRCPCAKCKNRKFWDAENVKLHLLRNGFIRDYYVWNRHEEPYIIGENEGQSSTNYLNVPSGTSGDNLMYNMGLDAAGPSFDPHHSEEMPNPEAHTHTVKNDKKTYIHKKAERVNEKIEELRMQRSQPIEGSSEPQPVDEDQLYLDAVGGIDNRNRIYGMGSLQSVIYPSENCNAATNRYTSSNFNNDYYEMQAELQEMKDQVKELQDMRDQEFQDMRKQMEEMKRQLAMVLNNQN